MKDKAQFYQVMKFIDEHILTNNPELTKEDVAAQLILSIILDCNYNNIDCDVVAFEKDYPAIMALQDQDILEANR